MKSEYSRLTYIMFVHGLTPCILWISATVTLMQDGRILALNETYFQLWYLSAGNICIQNAYIHMFHILNLNSAWQKSTIYCPHFMSSSFGTENGHGVMYLEAIEPLKIMTQSPISKQYRSENNFLVCKILDAWNSQHVFQLISMMMI